MIESGDFPIEKTIEYALELFNSDFGCAEAVLAAVSKATGQDDTCIPHLASGFTVGLGGLGEVCGAVSGGVLAMGLLYGQDASVIPKTREFVHQFAEQNGALRCIDLLGLDESSVEDLVASALNRKNEVCDGLVSSAVQELLDLLADSEK